jgi:DNA-binding MarR family transcriptional regulator
LGQLSDADWRLLRVFLAVVDCGGMTAAELELNISTSTISRHVKDLEARLGLVLCRRGRAGFALTPAGERIVAESRQLLAATEQKLAEIRQRVIDGKLTGQDNIGVRVGKVVNKYRMAKHFALDITDTKLQWSRRQEQIDAEAALDGLYIIRTSVQREAMDAPSCVRNYKSLAQVERAFRSLKTVDLKVRPIHHRTADRVRAHILLCMLAYYVEWHMREAWRGLLFADTEQEIKQTRDPVAPAQRSASAKAKVAARELEDGTPVHSFGTLMADLSTIVRNTCRSPLAGAEAPSFEAITTPTAAQRRAFELIENITL